MDLNRSNHVIILSQDITAITLIETTLQSDYQLSHAFDLASALALFEENTVTVIIIDAVSLEDEELFKILQELGQNQDARPLILTSKSSEEFIHECIEKGAKDVLTAPHFEQMIYKRTEAAFIENARSNLSVNTLPREEEKQPLFYDMYLLIFNIHRNPNDHEGDDSADCLAKFTDILQKHLRKNDILIPHTPDHFVLMLFQTPLHLAQEILTTISLEIKEQQLSFSVRAKLVPWNHTCNMCSNEGSQDFDHLVEIVHQMAKDLCLTTKAERKSDLAITSL